MAHSYMSILTAREYVVFTRGEAQNRAARLVERVSEWGRRGEGLEVTAEGRCKRLSTHSDLGDVANVRWGIEVGSIDVTQLNKENKDVKQLIGWMTQVIQINE